MPNAEVLKEKKTRPIDPTTSLHNIQRMTFELITAVNIWNVVF